MISLIVFTDKYLGHIQTLYTNGISLHFNYIQINNNKDSSWEDTHYMYTDHRQELKEVSSMEGTTLKKLFQEPEEQTLLWFRIAEETNFARETTYMFRTVSYPCFGVGGGGGGGRLRLRF